ncbi:MAG: sigma-54 dependent transcriptional regulator [Acidobacteriota bacterium]|nr:sigma-54 dependent transcriptional regulator [Acidobacteriota bacterium]
MRTDPVKLVGSSPALDGLRREIENAARCDAKVLIAGESGVGKEVVANLIHEGSARRRARLVNVNCAALTETLLETELFGHVRGSFTGAYRDRPGVFELAHRGTAFMDEIGETSARMQGMLLRFLETGEIQRVGSDEPPTIVDVRILAATNRVLADRVAEGAFREDLYYRLNIIQICVPPLRERREDIPLLLQFFLETFSAKCQVKCPSVSPLAVTALTAYHWPGNVRELKNVVERLLSRGLDRDITSDDLPPEIGGRGRIESSIAPASAVSLADKLYDRVVKDRESFWNLIHAMFMAHDLTRDDLRAIVHRGLRQTSGNYRMLVELFGMPPTDYKRFLSFLRKYHCQMPFQQFRSAAGAEQTVDESRRDRRPRPPVRVSA